MHAKIIFICTGNTYHSLVAEGLFRRLLTGRGIMDITYDSAGLFANPGEPAADDAVTACHKLGVDLSARRAKPLSQEMLQSADLFVVMMQSHTRVLKSSRVPQEKIKVLSGGIGDPFDGNIAIYHVNRDQIQKAFEELLHELGH